MIGYFLKADREQATRLVPLIAGPNGLSSFVKREFRKLPAGDELKLILIQLLVEGELSLGVPVEMTLGRFSKKDKSIAVKVPIRRESLSLPDDELQSLLIELTCKAIALVERSCGKSVKTDFIGLKNEFLRIARIWTIKAQKAVGSERRCRGVE